MASYYITPILPIDDPPAALRRLQVEDNGLGQCTCLPGVTPTRIDSTHIQVDFDTPVLVIPTLTFPGSYEIIPVDPNPESLHNLTCIGVTLGTQTPGSPYNTVTRVTLVTDEQGPSDYNVTVYGLELVPS